VRFLGDKVFDNAKGTERELFEVYCSSKCLRLFDKHPPCVFKIELLIPVWQINVFILI
jgi:hypothetical protein